MSIDNVSKIFLLSIRVCFVLCRCVTYFNIRNTMDTRKDFAAIIHFLYSGHKTCGIFCRHIWVNTTNTAYRGILFIAHAKRSGCVDDSCPYIHLLFSSILFNFMCFSCFKLKPRSRALGCRTRNKAYTMGITRSRYHNFALCPPKSVAAGETLVKLTTTARRLERNALHGTAQHCGQLRGETPH